MERILTIITRLLPYLYYLCLASLLMSGVIRIAGLLRSSSKFKEYARTLRTIDFRRFQDSEHIMPVSLILPATQSVERLVDSVENLLLLEYKQFEVIVVANSDRKSEWESLRNHYRLLPFQQPYKKMLKSGEIRGVYRSAEDVRLIVLDQASGSRPDALNAGVNISSYPIVAVTYPELRLTKDSLLKMVYTFVSDPNCVFVGAYPRIGNEASVECDAKLKPLGEMQNIERLRMLATRKAGYVKLGIYLPANVLTGAYLKSIVLEAGGFSGETEAEMADLLLRIHTRCKLQKRVCHTRLMPEAVCYQLPLKTMRDVCAERSRTQAAMLGVIKRNRTQARKMQGIFYTRVAERGWPTLELIGIVIVALSAAFGAVTSLFLVSYLLLSVLLGAVQSVVAVLLEQRTFQRQTDTGLLIRRYMLAIWENFGYRARVSLAKIFYEH